MLKLLTIFQCVRALVDRLIFIMLLERMSFRERRTAEKRKRIGYFYIKDPWFESGHQIPKSSSKVE